MKLIVALAVACSFAASQLLMGATYYVSTNGLDTNPGTQQQPWRTVQQAVNVAGGGDTVLIGSGDYDEVVNTKYSASGASSSRIVIDGQGVAKLFRLEHFKPFYTFQNLKFGRINTDPVTRSLALLETGTHHTIVSNCFFDGNGTIYSSAINMTAGDGVFDPEAPSFCTIVSNNFTGTKGQAVVYITGTSNIFIGNRIFNVVQCDFLRLWGQYNIIRANIFSNNVPAPEGEEVGFHPDFIQTFGNNGRGSRHHLIEGNKVIDHHGQLSQLVEGTEADPMLIGTGAIGDWTFRNNVFANLKLGASITIPGTKWYNNVFYRCNYTGGHVLNLGHGDRGSSAGVRAFNNVFLDCGLVDADNSGWYAVNEAYQDRQFDYNYVGKNNYGKLREENPPSSGFRWYEPNGINGGDPGFVNVSTYDFHLRADSPLIDRGTAIASFSHDFDGKLRPQLAPWEIGAFQFATPIVVVTRPAPPSQLHIRN